MKINKSHYSKYCDIFILYIIELDRRQSQKRGDNGNRVYNILYLLNKYSQLLH